MASIPPYFIYDGFEGDLDAALVYECLIRHNDVADDVFAHLKIFLRACLSSHNSTDEKPYVDATVFDATPMGQHKWSKQKKSYLFPVLAA